MPIFFYIVSINSKKYLTLSWRSLRVFPFRYFALKSTMLSHAKFAKIFTKNAKFKLPIIKYSFCKLINEKCPTIHEFVSRILLFLQIENLILFKRRRVRSLVKTTV